MYARESFTIAEVADLLSIRRLSDSYQDEFPVECPFCGDLRGKCGFCICKNGELKNVYHCYHCGASGNIADTVLRNYPAFMEGTGIKKPTVR